MTTVYETILNTDVLNKIKSFNFTTMRTEDLNDHKDKKIIVNENENKEILSIAFVQDNIEIDVCDELEKEIGWVYEDEEDKEYLKEISQRLCKGITIKAIESLKQGTGTGTKIVNYIKEKYGSILLYDMADAEEYWGIQGV